MPRLAILFGVLLILVGIGGYALGGVNKGFELWKYLGLVVLGLLVFETLMTRRMVNLQKKVDVASAGLPPGPAAAAA